jgi:translation initiation factor IF-3
MVGVVPLQQGLQQAAQEGLDLVEVSPNASPPVCKILDYGKFRYEIQKKAKEAKKKQKVIHIKEIKVRPNIDVHDYEVKLKAAKRFIEDGDKVKVTLKFRGREMAHIDLAKEVLDRFQKDLSAIAKPEHPAKLEGRQMVLMLAPEAHK